MPKTAVTVGSWSELFPANLSSFPSFLVLRAPNAPPLERRVFDRAAEYYLARYNAAFMFRNLPGLRRTFMTSFFARSSQPRYVSTWDWPWASRRLGFCQ